MKRLALPAFALAVVLSGGVTGCSNDPSATAVEQPASAPAGQLAAGRVDAAQFATVIAQPGVQIIDVRTPQEFSDGHIENAVNIPLQRSDFAQRVSKLDPNGTYAVYCRSANRSKAAVTEMTKAGLNNVYELAGGTVAWTAAGRPLVR